jgi:hypothetical protein
VHPDTSSTICLDGNSAPSVPCIATNGTGHQVDVSTSRWENFGETVATGQCNDGEATSDCPFTNGSGMNGPQIVGDKIVSFNDGGNCLVALGVLEGDAAVMESCISGAPDDLWVLEPDGFGYDEIVNVGFSNERYADGGGYNQPYGLGTGCAGSGCTVSLDNENSESDYSYWSGSDLLSAVARP